MPRKRSGKRRGLGGQDEGIQGLEGEEQTEIAEQSEKINDASPPPASTPGRQTGTQTQIDKLTDRKATSQSGIQPCSEPVRKPASQSIT